MEYWQFSIRDRIFSNLLSPESFRSVENSRGKSKINYTEEDRLKDGLVRRVERTIYEYAPPEFGARQGLTPRRDRVRSV